MRRRRVGDREDEEDEEDEEGEDIERDRIPLDMLELVSCKL